MLTSALIIAVYFKYRNRIVLAWRHWRLAWYQTRVLDCQSATHFYLFRNPDRVALWKEREEAEVERRYEYTKRILGPASP